MAVKVTAIVWVAQPRENRHRDLRDEPPRTDHYGIGNQGRRNQVSISAVGGMTPHAALQQISPGGKPESAEVAGVPDRDGDSDDHGVSAATASRVKTGSVNRIA